MTQAVIALGRATAAALVLAAAAPGPSLTAQVPTADYGPELRPYIGTFVPTGRMSDEFEALSLLGVQGAFAFAHRYHVVTSIGWVYGHNTLMQRDLTDIWQYDIGFEMIRRVASTGNWTVQPFVGLGGGGRTYNYRDPAAATFTAPAGYAALGGELQAERVSLRAEMRTYVAGFESPVTGERGNRTNLGLTLGLAYHLR